MLNRTASKSSCCTLHLWLFSTFALGLLFPLSVFAHASDRGFILLLPTGYYLTGGTLAVLASVLLVGLIRQSPTLPSRGFMLRLPRVIHLRNITSLVSSLCLLTLVLAGFFGDSDPLDNPLPLTIWTLGWVLLTIAHAVFGNLWSYLNPWTGLLSLISSKASASNSTALPSHLHRTPYYGAIALFIAFAWFELVSLSPEDPVTLATVVSGYWIFNFIGMLWIGQRRWMASVEPFSVFFRFVSLLSSLTRHQPNHSLQNNAIGIGWPGQRILQHPAIHWSGAVFILVTLASVSFDGLNKTFWWLHLHDVNPLAFEGRSSVVLVNSKGLFLACFSLLASYLCAVWLGWRYADKTVPLSVPFSKFALAIIPISLGYHLAHYLTQILVNGQYALRAFADPFDSGLNLAGLRGIEVSTSFLSNHHYVEIIWKIQLACIVIGHLLSVFIAHLLALQIYQRKAVAGQLPLALLMVLYTLFGLWLLSTPTGL